MAKAEETGSGAEDLEVRHDADRQRFVLPVEVDGEDKEVHLDYRKQGEGVWVYAHTFTPPEARGQGLAGRVVKVALEYAREHDLRVVPSCPYVDEYMKEHPEYQDLRAS